MGGRPASGGRSAQPTASGLTFARTTPRIFRATISIGEDQTQVLVEQTAAVAPERVGELVGHVSRTELEAIDTAFRLALQLD